MAGLMKNNRGDIPITILVIGVFAICMLAILSFISNTVSLRNSFGGLDLIKQVNEDAEIGLKSFPLYEERNKTHWELDYLKRGFKDEILFSVEYPGP